MRRVLLSLVLLTMLPVASVHGQVNTTRDVQLLYVAYLGRPADPGGLFYWRQVLEVAGGDRSALANAFAQSGEFRAFSEGKNSLQRVDVLYRRLFARPADFDGLIFWAGRVDAGDLSLARLPDQIALNAGVQDAAVLNAKIEVATAFTDAIDNGEELRAYSSECANAVASALLATVVDEASAAAATAVIDQTIAGLASCSDPVTLPRLALDQSVSRVSRNGARLCGGVSRARDLTALGVTHLRFDGGTMSYVDPVNKPVDVLPREEGFSFCVDVFGLLPATRYRFYTYATNPAGTASNANETVVLGRNAFDTLADVPRVNALDVSLISGDSAAIGGAVSQPGSTPIVARGVLLSATANNANPLLGGPMVLDLDAASPMDPFSVFAFGLMPATAYSYRIYAANGAGVGYSPVGQFTTTGVGESNASPTLMADTQTTVLEDSRTGVLQISVGDIETAPGSLLLSASSANQELLSDENLVKGLAGTGGNRSLTFLPAANGYGNSFVLLGLRDGNGGLVTLSSELVVTPVNDPPRFSLASSPRLLSGASGTRVLPNFVSASPGEYEHTQNLAFTVTEVADPANVAAAVTVSPQGALGYQLSGNVGSARYRIEARDDGGVANNGLDRAPPQFFNITVGNGPALILDASSERSSEDTPAKGTRLRSTSRLLATNVGAVRVEDVRLRVPAPAELGSVNWTCRAQSSACTPGYGSGAIDTLVSLDPGESAELVLTGLIIGGRPYVEITAGVSVPEGVTLTETGLERVVALSAATDSAVHRSGFE